MALAHNLALSWRWRNVVRWVVVDLNPPEERQRVVSMLQNVAPESVEVGQVRLWAAAAWSGWHACVAKNTSHLLAIETFGSDIVVCNFDGDNIVTEPFLRDITENADRMARWRDESLWSADIFRGGATAASLPALVGTSYKAPSAPSTTGRVACGGKVFLALRGYDESFEPMGGQDVDLSRRLARLGPHRYVSSDQVTGNAILNDLTAVPAKQRWQRETAAKMANVAAKHRASTWEAMNQRNIARSKAAIAQGQLQRNFDMHIGLPAEEVLLRRGGVRGVSLTLPAPQAPPTQESAMSSSDVAPGILAPPCIRRCIIYTGGVRDKMTRWANHPVIRELQRTDLPPEQLKRRGSAHIGPNKFVMVGLLGGTWGSLMGVGRPRGLCRQMTHVGVASDACGGDVGGDDPLDGGHACGVRDGSAPAAEAALTVVTAPAMPAWCGRNAIGRVGARGVSLGGRRLRQRGIPSSHSLCVPGHTCREVGLVAGRRRSRAEHRGGCQVGIRGAAKGDGRVFVF